ncbi:MAG: peptidoglycan bridge formation glycyltransferase FemA/FemB family protein [Candidatus Cloacimonetes bacterium]|nr:peptidoglycan bridge formation glycyltransferase FemA/FemB family protein [Candidatus Cloacimonadota bacterium]
MGIKTVTRNVARLSRKELQEWERILDISADATVFHTPAWIKATADYKNIPGFVILAYRNKYPVGVFAFFLYKVKWFKQEAISCVLEMPYGGPVAAAEGNEGIITALLNAQKKRFLQVSTAIITSPGQGAAVFRRHGFRINVRETLIVPLDVDEETLWSNIGSDNRRMVRKARKRGVTVEERGWQELPVFHDLLDSTRERLELATPIPLAYYQQIYKALAENKAIKLLVAYLENKPIAAGLFLYFKNRVTWWSAGTDRDYWNYAPGTLLQWQIMATARENNYDSYDMLHYHDSKGNLVPSLKSFKEKFGAREMKFYHAVKTSKLYEALIGIRGLIKK